MINESTLEVQLTLDDKMTEKANKSFQSLKTNSESLTKSVRNLGNELTRAGRNMAFLGAAIAGPLALAFKTTSNYSIEAGNSLKNLSSVATSFQTTIGTAMIPIVDKFTKILQNLDNWFKSLDPKLRTMIVQGLMIAAAFLVLGGATLTLVGNLIKLTSATIHFVTANAPLLIIVGILIAMIVYWEQIRNVVLPIITGLQIAVDILAIGYEKVALALTHVLGFTAALAGQQDLATWFEEQAISIEKNIAMLQEDMTNAMGGTGWAQTVDTTATDIKTKFQDLMNFFSMDFTTSVNTSFQQFGQNFAQTFKAAYDQATNIGAKSSQILIQQVQMFSDGFGQGFAKMIVEGKNFGESMKQLFRDMAEQFIAAVISMMVQWMAFMALKTAAKFFGVFHGGGMVMHSGGVVRAHDGLAVDEVPIIAQRGEGILSRRGMDALGGAGQLNALNQGKSSRGSVTVNIENASFSTEDAAEETLQRLSQLISEKSRSRMR